ncbi:hypothetical protein ACFLYO_03225 [Chloroflexota bacterium]
MPPMTDPNNSLSTNRHYRQIIATINACEKAAALIATQPASDRNNYLLLIVQRIIDTESFGDLRDDVLHAIRAEVDSQLNVDSLSGSDLES